MNVNYDFGRIGVTKLNKDEYLEILDTNFNYFVKSKFVSIDKVSIEVEYDDVGLYNYEDLSDTSTIFKLQCIKSIIELVINTNALFGIELTKENLYFSSNSHAYQLIKTLDQSRLSECEYVTIIKSFLGDLFLKEDFISILSSEGELLKKNKLIADIAHIQTFDEFLPNLDLLIKQVQEIEANELVHVKQDFINANKKKHKFKNIFIVLLLLFMFYILLIFIPNRTSQLKAINSYENNIYEDVITDLSATNIKTMSPVMKYIMSESTIRLADLSDMQKDNILYNLSPSVDEKILDYWVYIGKGDYESAYNQAITNNDAQQKAYVLLLLIEETKNDPDLDKEDKETKLSEYNGELDATITSINEDQEQAE